MSLLPFVLHKWHKSTTKCNWKKIGIIFEDNYHFEYVYNIYIHETHCDLCGKEFTKSLDRQLEHNHKTGGVRNIVCNKCNHHKKDYTITSNTGEKHISKCKDANMKLGYYFKIQIRRDGESVLNTTKTTLENAIIVRDEFLKNHPEIYK